MDRCVGHMRVMFLLCVCLTEISTTKPENTMLRLFKYVNDKINTERNDTRKELASLNTKLDEQENVLGTLQEQNLNSSKDLINKIEQIENELKSLKVSTENLMMLAFQSREKSRSCLDLFNDGIRSDGIYVITLDHLERKNTLKRVYCDMTTDGGGWTVFQRRQDGSVDFNRDWNDYKFGFGELNGEFWLGNEYMSMLTVGETHELRIELEDYEGNQAYANYSKFKIGPESTNYTLEVNGYTGDAGDSLGENPHKCFTHTGMQFSTKDRDNDNYSGKCVNPLRGGWWFNYCYSSRLNGLYCGRSSCKKSYIKWNMWKGNHLITFTEMKLR